MVCYRFYNLFLVLQIIFVSSHNLSNPWEVFSSCSLKSFKNSGSLATDDLELDGVAVASDVVGAVETVAVHGGVREGEHSDEGHRLVVGGASVVVLNGAVAVGVG